MWRCRWLLLAGAGGARPQTGQQVICAICRTLLSPTKGLFNLISSGAIPHISKLKSVLVGPLVSTRKQLLIKNLLSRARRFPLSSSKTRQISNDQGSRIIVSQLRSMTTSTSSLPIPPPNFRLISVLISF